MSNKIMIKKVKITIKKIKFKFRFEDKVLKIFSIRRKLKYF